MRLLCIVERNAGPPDAPMTRIVRWSCGLLTREAVSMKSTRVAKGLAAKRVAAVPTLLAGGNPQITKADGDAPVQAYIAAMPGWKSDLGRRLDALIVRTVPTVHMAVKSNR
jgi:hypothetical protein